MNGRKFINREPTWTHSKAEYSAENTEGTFILVFQIRMNLCVCQSRQGCVCATLDRAGSVNGHY